MEVSNAESIGNDPHTVHASTTSHTGRAAMIDGANAIPVANQQQHRCTRMAPYKFDVDASVYFGNAGRSATRVAVGY